MGSWSQLGGCPGSAAVARDAAGDSVVELSSPSDSETINKSC